MKRLSAIISGIFLAAGVSFALPPQFNAVQCEGSAMPYPERKTGSVPDSLTPIMINHVGRHGARFASSSKRSEKLREELGKAAEASTITPDGERLLNLVKEVSAMSAGRWGALDSLGMAEQRALASRMYQAAPGLFEGATIEAVSSYAPRCIMSMDCFTHQLARLNNRVKIYTSSGRQNSPLMRPFDLDKDFIDFVAEMPYRQAYEEYFDSHIDPAAARRWLGDMPGLDDKRARDFVYTAYGFLAGLNAAGLAPALAEWFSPEEYNSLWSIDNLSQYLKRTATTYSSIPADIAADLLEDIINTSDEVVAGKAESRVQLRFGHAETLMPLLSLMQIPGCYYMTNYLDTVESHWQSFNVVPMAANLQLWLFKTAKGKVYARFDLNEVPVALLPGSDAIYIPWTDARNYLRHRLPYHRQL